MALTQEQRELVSEITRLSGGGKRLSSTSRVHGIYSSFTVPPFDSLKAVRDTAKRYVDWGVDVKGKIVADYGCNVGALAVELARQGASFVYGFEFNFERVAFCDRLFKHLGLKGKFANADFRISVPICFGVPDIVFCCSVDSYVADWKKLYAGLAAVGSKMLCIESNRQDISCNGTWTYLDSLGFDVEYIGKGDSGGISRRREMFRCTRRSS